MYKEEELGLYRSEKKKIKRGSKRNRIEIKGFDTKE